MGAELCIAGTGAMACLFAARLAAAGERVTMAGTWPEGLAALRTSGVTLDGPDGPVERFPVTVVDAREEATGPVAAMVIVLVKTWQTGRVAAWLDARLPDDGVCLTLQNGLGNREQLAANLGDERVAAGTISAGATLLGPGHVRAGGSGGITVGRHPRLRPLLSRLEAAGFPVTAVESVDGALWGKAVINAGINPLTALLGLPNGALLERAAANAVMLDAVREAADVAQALGIALPYARPEAAVADVARRTASNLSSMLQDVRRGAPTEIDAICGEITGAGERLGVPTPVNRTLWRLVRALVDDLPAEA